MSDAKENNRDGDDYFSDPAVTKNGGNIKNFVKSNRDGDDYFLRWLLNREVVSTVEMEPSTGFTPKPDRRKFIPPPPPVSLVTVEDARLFSTKGWERELDDFYVGLLQFERDMRSDAIVYKADNFRIIFELFEEPIEREDYRMLGIIVKSLAATAEKFREAQIEFQHERGLNPTEERLVLTDPAGNWLRIMQSNPV